VSELESLAVQPGFWDKREQAEAILRETKQLQDLIARIQGEERRLSDAVVLVDLAAEAEDEDSAREAAALGVRVAQALDEIEFRRMLSGEHDAAGAIVEINAGAGGVDAADWAQMLLRMLLRFCEQRGWKADVLDEQPAEEAGIKSATVMVEGEFAFGLLRAEHGVHRLVRISPFDGNARRQTSFAAVTVAPDIEQEIDIAIPDGDLRVDTYRAGGAGGQHVNKTDSAVRITHLPTGIVVQCQNERSQHKNKSFAMKVLKAKLFEVRQAEADAKSASIVGERKKIEWGSQIRSYVLAPYQLVTDHRTDLKVGKVEAVLDGDLEPFIRAYLLQQGSGGGAAAG
jgi:peptide chain release factor 2